MIWPSSLLVFLAVFLSWSPLMAQERRVTSDEAFQDEGSSERVDGGASNHSSARGEWDSDHTTAPVARAFPTGMTIRVDGILDEDPWSTAVPVTEFIQLDPFEGLPGSQRTEVRILFDQEALYIGAMLHDTGVITTRLARRDTPIPDADFFIVLLDSYHDHETAYRFAVNPSGMRRDEVVSGGRDMGGDTSWDPVWELATAVTDSGWVAEMRIPFSQLRFGRDPEQLWGIQFERKINRNQERAVFSYTPKTERGGVARFGHLEGIREVQAGQRLEVLPYVGGRSEFRTVEPLADVDFANPFRSGADHFGSAGLDVKYRVSSNLTLDATIRPDFGQVEMDPAELNLTVFETRFEERRPFFVEGQEIFDYGEGGPAGSTGRGPQLLYSRRIGRSPQGVLPGDAVFADVPTSATIQGAAKLTGKVGAGWSLGFLNAVTGLEEAPFVDAAGIFATAHMEPATNYMVGRIRKDGSGGRTRFGVIATAVNRRLADAALDSRLRSAAYAAGLEFRHESSDRRYRFSSTFSPSLIQGSPDAMLRVQRASTRYLQRPDAGHLNLDPLATSMMGYYAMVDLAKQAGMYQAKVAVAHASPGYEVNDLGFQTASDRIIVDTNFSRIVTRPGEHLRSWRVQGGPDGVWNSQGQLVFAEFNVFGNWQWLNNWGGSARLAVNPETWDDRLTRGGPMAREPGGHSGNLGLNSDSRRSLVMRGNVRWGADDDGGWQRGGNVSATWRPRDNWEFRVGPSFTRRHTTAQYLTSVADPLAQETFGRRYVFAGLDQSTLGVEARASLTFSPTLSFELFAQPFLSRGIYGGPGELVRPGTFSFAGYGEERGTLARGNDGGLTVDPDGPHGPARSFTLSDPDFSFRSLRGNAVLRWEWRPGSTLFLVWQQSRAGTLSGGELDENRGEGLGRHLGLDPLQSGRELLSLRPDNIFLVKLSYWLNP